MPDRKHTVVSGDTLSQISARYLYGDPLVLAGLLARLNSIPDPDLIFPGQVLDIPETEEKIRARLEVGRVALPSPPPHAAVQLGGSASTLAANEPAPGAPVVLYLPPDGRITSGYGPRGAIPSLNIPPHHHPGIDVWWSGCFGYNLKAPISGTVTHAGDNGNGYGVHVIIDNRAGGLLLLAHLAETPLQVGQEVTQGSDIVGSIGSTGKSTGAHLHLEFQQDPEDDGWTWGSSEDPASSVTIVRV